MVIPTQSFFLCNRVSFYLLFLGVGAQKDGDQLCSENTAGSKGGTWGALYMCQAHISISRALSAAHPRVSFEPGNYIGDSNN